MWFFHLAVLFRFHHLVFVVHHVFLSEEIKMMMMVMIFYNANQSAYRRHHSTETAMLRVLSDVLTAADAQRSRCLVYWICQQRSTALTTSFCCSDFDETLNLPRQLSWTTSFFTDRTELSKCYTRAAFQLFSLSSMGSHRDPCVLGPLLFVLHTAEIGRNMLSMGSSSTSMLTTAKFTLPRQ